MIINKLRLFCSRFSRSVHYSFKPNFKIIAKIKPIYDISDLEKEIGVYSASPDFIRKNCGAITNSILDAIPSWYYHEAKELGLYPNCDVRIHRLYPGDYPAYPGWHCDGEFRETYFSQPDLNKIPVSKHIFVCVSSHSDGVANPEFLDRAWDFHSDEVNQSHTLWQQVNYDINNSPEKIPIFKTYDGDMVCFDNWSLHRVMPTINRGWRIFFRMSMWHKPNLGNSGMFSKQETVYLDLSRCGW